MTEGERQVEIAAMVTERNTLRREIACLENKLERINRALSEIMSAIGAGRKLQAVQGGGILAASDGMALPPVDEIMRAQNQLVDAKAQLAVLAQRLDEV